MTLEAEPWRRCGSARLLFASTVRWHREAWKRRRTVESNCLAAISMMRRERGTEVTRGRQRAASDGGWNRFAASPRFGSSAELFRRTLVRMGLGIDAPGEPSRSEDGDIYVARTVWDPDRESAQVRQLVTVRARQVRVVPRPGVQPTTSGVSDCSGGENWRAVTSRALRCGPAPTALKEARHGTARFGPGARRRFCR